MFSVLTSYNSRSWVHRYLGEGKTKGCDVAKDVWKTCITMETGFNYNAERALQWTLPGDQSSDGTILICVR